VWSAYFLCKSCFRRRSWYPYFRWWDKD
jgi:hypothetical protein